MYIFLIVCFKLLKGYDLEFYNIVESDYINLKEFMVY